MQTGPQWVGSGGVGGGGSTLITAPSMLHPTTHFKCTHHLLSLLPSSCHRKPSSLSNCPDIGGILFYRIAKQSFFAEVCLDLSMSVGKMVCELQKQNPLSCRARFIPAQEASPRLDPKNVSFTDQSRVLEFNQKIEHVFRGICYSG